VSDAEKRLITYQLLALISLSIVLSLANAWLKARRAMEANEVVRDAELFLKASRLLDLILPEHKKIIEELEAGWSNACYRGPLRGISISEWIRQNSTDTLSP